MPGKYNIRSQRKSEAVKRMSHLQLSAFFHLSIFSVLNKRSKIVHQITRDKRKCLKLVKFTMVKKFVGIFIMVYNIITSNYCVAVLQRRRSGLVDIRTDGWRSYASCCTAHCSTLPWRLQQQQQQTTAPVISPQCPVSQLHHWVICYEVVMSYIKTRAKLIW